MGIWTKYYFPASIQEALEILCSHKGKARIIAGGTDLIPQLKEHSRSVEYLVDISRIPELKSIEKKDDTIVIGAGITHSEVAASQLIRDQVAVLAEAARTVGSPQIRNVGTIAGNVINAQPAADTAVALFSLDAEAEIATINGIKIVPIEKLYREIGVSTVDSTSELVTAVRFQCLKQNQGSAFQRLAQRKALALPMINVATVVTIENNSFGKSRITVAPVSYLPFRARKAETALEGTAINDKSMAMAAQQAGEEAQPRDSVLRGSADYRRSIVNVLVKRGLDKAAQRAQ